MTQISERTKVAPENPWGQSVIVLWVTFATHASLHKMGGKKAYGAAGNSQPGRS